MGFEKHSSKGGGGGGGYVGGLLQLFDWNGKSRKKLFAAKSDLLPERSKQGKRSDGNLPTTRVRLVCALLSYVLDILYSFVHGLIYYYMILSLCFQSDVDDDDDGDDDNWARSIRGSDYSCASSVTDDDGNGTRAPGVVARLMGLDSMPTSFVEPNSTPFFDTRSLQDAQIYRKTPLQSGTKLEGFSRNYVESRSQNMPKRPIERFQTETLPPKSAKSMPITHHKLLSPIKSPSFISAKDAADIMEAASRIIKPQTQGASRSKTPSLGSSSIPLRVQDLKDRMDAASKSSRFTGASRRPVESNAVKYLKNQPMNKSWNGSDYSTEFKASPDSGDGNFVGLKKKGKAVSLAVQAKVNVQRREGLSSNRSSQSHKEPYEFKSKQALKGQVITTKNMQKRSPKQNTIGILKQNNQKQNCVTNKEKLPTKLSPSNIQGRQTESRDSSIRQSRTMNKATGNSRVGVKTSLVTSNVEKEVPLSKSRNFPQKKRFIEGERNVERGNSVKSFSVVTDVKRMEPSIGNDGILKRTEENKNKGMDVISFTFTSPMVKAMPGSQLSSHIVGIENKYNGDSNGETAFPFSRNAKLSSLGLNVVGGDDLNILLEEKLRELTYGVESSRRVPVRSGSVLTSPSLAQDLVSAFNSGSIMPTPHYRRVQLGLHNGVSSYPYTSFHGTGLKMDLTLQSREDTGLDVGCLSGSDIKVKEEVDQQNPSPVSILEPSFSNDSYNSSDKSGDGYSNDGITQYSSLEAQQLVELSYPKKSLLVDPELSDSASSVFAALDCRKHATRFTLAANGRTEEQKLLYMKEILCNVDLMFKDFTLGRAREIINPHLFDQLEKTWSRADAEDKDSWLRRKALFDSARECLDLRCRRYASGGCRTWSKGVALLQRKDWLAEEVCKEISGWESMANWMVDELVDKDMSTQCGRWLDFEIEEFEEGVEIEKSILSSLIDEVVADIF
ncbi:hypothetical protein Sjap_006917 [Stephania japonica]|uniref:DUF4378 domain-containing protein n=1 Tax=Stephania japonica TaxID=461633 RepID=A0AAP0K8A5_9MAGN